MRAAFDCDVVVPVDEEGDKAGAEADVEAADVDDDANGTGSCGGDILMGDVRVDLRGFAYLCVTSIPLPPPVGGSVAVVTMGDSGLLATSGDDGRRRVSWGGLLVGLPGVGEVVEEEVADASGCAIGPVVGLGGR